MSRDARGGYRGGISAEQVGPPIPTPSAAIRGCKFGGEEYDGTRFCHEHSGRARAGQPTWAACDAPGEPR